AKERPHLVAGISDVSGGRVLPVVGGVLIRDKAGAILGAVGISGDTSDNDEAAAIAGIEAAGFTADPG
ncbi:heme-binding protein, partial [Mesorhizobium sp. M7A.F.Ca.CA.004.06.1.1]